MLPTLYILVMWMKQMLISVSVCCVVSSVKDNFIVCKLLNYMLQNDWQTVSCGFAQIELWQEEDWNLLSIGQMLKLFSWCSSRVQFLV
jgi:hypothetical protein